MSLQSRDPSLDGGLPDAVGLGLQEPPSLGLREAPSLGLREAPSLGLREAPSLVERSAEALFGSLTDGVLIHQHGRIAYANRRLCTLLGFEPDEFHGRPALALYPDSDYLMALARWQRAAFSASRTAVTHHRLLRRDGGTVSVEVSSLLLSIEDGEALVIEVISRSPASRKGSTRPA